MQKTITPIDNTLYIERNYDGDKIEETIRGSMKAQKVWSEIEWMQVTESGTINLSGTFFCAQTTTLSLPLMAIDVMPNDCTALKAYSIW